MRFGKPAVVCLIVLGCIVTLADSRLGATLAEDGKDTANSPSSGVATIDTNRILKQYEQFKRRTKTLQGEVALSEALVKSKRQEAARLKTQLTELTPGTDEHRELQAEIEQADTKLQRDIEDQKKVFLKKEADIFLQAYNDMTKLVAEYCRARGIRMVLRFNQEPASSSDQTSVLRLLNQQIVYQEGLDITDAIIEALNSQESSAQE